MGKVYVLLLTVMLNACSTYNAPEIMMRHEDETLDMARCGSGLGIDNKLGVIIKSEAAKSGGELSAHQSSEIFGKAVTQGLMSADGKNYEAYTKCILELDKRRNDKKSSELLERIQQPALKVYLESPQHNSSDRFARRLVVENTGEELTELEVTPAPFLFMTDLCVVTEQSDCRNEIALQKSQMAFIPIENYYVNVTFHGRYKGELYSIKEDSPSRLRDVAEDFMRSVRSSRTGSMTEHVITLVRVRYKDKFQGLHERFIDVSLEQHELPTDLGKALFTLRTEWFKSNMKIDAARVSMASLNEVWNKTSAPMMEIPAPWQRYRLLRNTA